jgi:hypothetical protein
LWFEEYTQSLWLKLTPLPSLQSRAHASRERLRLERWQAGARDEDTARGVLGLFADGWLPSVLPESVGGWNQDPSELDPISRAEALARMGRVAQANEADITGVRSSERVPVQASEIVAEFDRLLGPAALFFAGTHEAVLALDEHWVGMLWLE